MVGSVERKICAGGLPFGGKITLDKGTGVSERRWWVAGTRRGRGGVGGGVEGEAERNRKGGMNVVTESAKENKLV